MKQSQAKGRGKPSNMLFCGTLVFYVFLALLSNFPSILLPSVGTWKKMNLKKYLISFSTPFLLYEFCKFKPQIFLYVKVFVFIGFEHQKNPITICTLCPTPLCSILLVHRNVSHRVV